jgi:gamma-glutamyltranspeptidase/glutathione hydrolase
MMRKIFLFTAITISLLFLPWGCSKKSAGSTDLSPANWPEGELGKYTRLGLVSNVPKPPVETGNGMVVGAFGPLAIRSGVEALKKGGNAVDAALTTTLTQVCLLAGSNVSYAGIIFLLYYDAKTGKIYSMHAGWNTVKEETDPKSIPFPNTPSGRQVLVPGFMAGVQAAHQRFGKLPFGSLFDPAIYFAEKGFIIDKALAVRIKTREDAIARFPGTKKILFKENGELYKKGDLLKQPQVAETLRQVAKQGADYMYRGEWAKKFVRAVRGLGGKMTLKDLEDYRVIWSEPYHTTYREYDIYAPGPPGTEGSALILAFNLLELANLKQYGHYSQSARALYQFIQISRLTEIFFYTEVEYRDLLGIFNKYLGMNDNDLSRQSLLSKQTAQRFWEKMQEPSWNDFQREIYLAAIKASADSEEYYKEIEKMTKKRAAAEKESGHSDCVAAVDKEGNVAAIVHTLNSSKYYGLGLTVDGVSVADTGSFEQKSIANMEPGARLSLGCNQVIVLKKQKPFLATSCIGAIHEATIQRVFNVLEFNMDPQRAAEMPCFFTPALQPSEYNKQTVGEGQFAEEILEAVRAMGQEIKVLPLEEQWLQVGGWVGIKIDPKTGKLKGGVQKDLNGAAAGY